MQGFIRCFFFIVLHFMIPEVLKSQIDLCSIAKSTISRSTNCKPGKYLVNSNSLFDKPYINIQGDYIEIDFKHAVMNGPGSRRDVCRESTHLFSYNGGDYPLPTESDDGICIWLDDDLLRERWDIHTPTIDDVQFSAAEGKHDVLVEYFEATALSVLAITNRNQ